MVRLSRELQRQIVRLISKDGPLNDQTIAEKLRGDVTTGDVFETTEYLAEQGLIQESEFAPGRWQTTEAGRAEAAQEGESSEPEPEEPGRRDEPKG